MNDALEMQISNIPLTYNSLPMTLTDIKGCKFTPALYLNSKTHYLVLVSHRPPTLIKPECGFYDVPDKGHLAWIRSFAPVGMSAQNIAGNRCYVWEAIEGMPPPNVIPKLFSSDTMGKVSGVGRTVSQCIEVKRK